jgi:splicing factor 3A subunit 2
MMVQVHLPQIKGDVIPRRRFMSAWEQKREPPNKNYQYLIVRTFLQPSASPVHMLTDVPQVAAEPYETIAFRIPAREIEDESDDAGYWNWSHWDPDTKQYSFQFMFRLTY